MNPLAQLRDIQLPKSVSFWPLAPGWYILIVILILAIILLLVVWRKRSARFNPRQCALAELNILKQTDPITYTNAGFLNEITSLLKRRLFVDNPREAIASLHGKDWLVFLDSKSGTTDFTIGVGQVLASGQYQVNTRIDRAELLTIIERLIKSC